MIKERVRSDIIHLKLEGCIEDRIFYLSTENPRDDLDSVSSLNDRLWDFILSENRHGLYRLGSLNQALLDSTNSSVEILNVSLLDNTKRIRLEENIKEVQVRIPQLQYLVKGKIADGQRLLFQTIEMKRRSLIDALRSKLEVVPINQSLPNADDLKKELLSNTSAIIEGANNEFASQMNELKIHIDQWVEDNLKQIRELLSHTPTQKNIDFSEINSLEMPKIDYSGAVGLGFLGLAVGIIAFPPYALFSGFLGLITNLFVSQESRRNKQINKIIETADGRTHKIIQKITSAYSECYKEHTMILDYYVSTKLKFYFDDLSKQMAALQVKKSLSNSEENSHVSAVARIRSLQHQIIELQIDLRSLVHMDDC